MERYDVVLYTPPTKQQRCNSVGWIMSRVDHENEGDHADESGSGRSGCGSMALVASSQPTTSSWKVPTHLKGSGCSKCRWRGCRSCKAAGGEPSITAAAHDLPAQATKHCGKCANCLDMKRFGGLGIKKKRCSSTNADEGSTSRAVPRPLPPGWSAVVHTSASRTYRVYHGPGGATARSTLEAWRRRQAAPSSSRCFARCR